MHITSYRTLGTIILALQCVDVPPWRRERRTSVRGEYFTKLIEQNILKDSNYYFDSLAIRLWSKDLKHLIPGNGLAGLQG